MPLLNYTTSVSTDKTVAQIHKLLIEAGARQIVTDYDDVGEPEGITFVTETPTGERAFRLPVNTVRVQIVLAAQRVEPRYRTPQQSARVAWRIAKDWVEAQLAIIRTEMVTLDQVMLPYMQAGSEGETVYELFRNSQLALGAGDG